MARLDRIADLVGAFSVVALQEPEAPFRRTVQIGQIRLQTALITSLQYLKLLLSRDVGVVGVLALVLDLVPIGSR